MPVAEIWPEAIERRLPRRRKPSLLLTPARHGTDGFFVAVSEGGNRVPRTSRRRPDLAAPREGFRRPCPVPHSCLFDRLFHFSLHRRPGTGLRSDRHLVTTASVVRSTVVLTVGVRAALMTVPQPPSRASMMVRTAILPPNRTFFSTFHPPTICGGAPILGGNPCGRCERPLARSGHDKAGRWRSAGYRSGPSFRNGGAKNESGGQGVAPEARRPPSVSSLLGHLSSSLNGEVTKSAVAEAASVVSTPKWRQPRHPWLSQAPRKAAMLRARTTPLMRLAIVSSMVFAVDPLSRKPRTLPPKG